MRDERPWIIEGSVYKTRLKLNADGSFDFRHEEDNGSFTEASGAWECEYEGEDIVVKVTGSLNDPEDPCSAGFQRTFSREDLLQNWEQ